MDCDWLTNTSIRSGLEMSLFVNAPQEEAFRSLMDYFTGRRVKILTSNKPSYVRVGIGSWIGFVFQGNAKGEVETTVTKRNGGSYVHFNFDFTKEYASGFIGAIVGALLLYGIGSWVANLMISKLPYSAIGEIWSLVYLIIIFGMVMLFATIMVMEGYYVSRTKKRFIEEFNKFMQSLTSKKD